MDAVMLVGRIMFSLMFVVSSVGHLTQSAAMTGYAQSKKVPLAQLAVLLLGVLMALGALSVILGVYADLGALVLAVVAFITAIMMHNFWTVADPQMRVGEKFTFFRNIGLVGGALVIYVVARKSGAEGDMFGWALGSPLWK